MSRARFYRSSARFQAAAEAVVHQAAVVAASSSEEPPSRLSRLAILGIPSDLVGVEDARAIVRRYLADPGMVISGRS